MDEAKRQLDANVVKFESPEDVNSFAEKHPGIDTEKLDANVNELPAAPPEAPGNDVDCMVHTAKEKCVLFHDKDGEAYATFECEGHVETWAVSNSGFRDWLSYDFFQENERVPRKYSIDDALAAISAIAKYGGEERQVGMRMAKFESGYCIDLCNNKWEMVVIDLTKKTWRITADSPVAFFRNKNMRALPTPEKGGYIEDLWQYLNIPERFRNIVLAWITDCYRSDTEFCLLEYVGGQGCGKSSTQSMIRDFIDPNVANLRRPSKKGEDFFVAAHNSFMQSYENMSYLSREASDNLCALLTGGGYATRKFRTNTEESVIEACCPVMINGIAVVVTEQDLLDRAIHISMESIANRKRKSDIVDSFEKNKGMLFGSLLDLFMDALEELPEVFIDEKDLPRMADFGLWGEAVYRVMGEPEGKFLADYRDMQQAGVYRTIDASPVASALKAHVEQYAEYKGTVNALFILLTESKPVGEAWPKSAKGFADAFRRASPALHKIGIEASIDTQRTSAGYICTLRKMPESDMTESP